MIELQIEFIVTFLLDYVNTDNIERYVNKSINVLSKLSMKSTTRALQYLSSAFVMLISVVRI